MSHQGKNKISARTITASLVVGGTIMGASQGIAMENPDSTQTDSVYLTTTDVVVQIEGADFEALKLAAQNGDKDAQFDLAVLYFKQQNKDSEDSFRYFKLASKQGHPMAQCYIGNHYYQGIIVEKNYSKAFKYYTLSAHQKNAEAQKQIGWIYLDGVYVKQDDEEAFKYFKLAADQSHQEAQIQTAFMYFNGHGVEKNYNEAFKNFKLTADQGNIIAQNQTGLMYFYGHGVGQNCKDAFKYFKLAADKGNAAAQNSLKFYVGIILQEYKYPKDNIKDYVNTAMLLIHKDYNVDDCFMILNVLEKIPPDELKNIVEMTATLFENMTNSSQRNLVLRALKEIKQEERESFVEIISPIVENLESNEVCGMLLRILVSIDVADRENFVEICIELVNGLDSEEACACIARYLAQFQPNERASIIQITNSLFLNMNDGFQRTYVLQALGLIPETEREEFMRIITPFIINIQDSNLSVNLLGAFSGIRTPEERESLAELATILLNGINSENDRADLFQTLITIPTDERASIVKIISPLIEDLTNGNERYNILLTFKYLPTVVHEKAIALFLELRNADESRFNEITNSFVDCLGFLIRNDASILELWHQTLNSKDKLKAKLLANIIGITYERLGLQEKDPLVQAVFDVLGLYEDDVRGKNYGFFRGLKQKRAEEITIDLTSLPKKIFGDLQLCLNPGYLKNLSNMAIPITFKDLPSHSKDFFTIMGKQVKQRLDENPETLKPTIFISDGDIIKEIDYKDLENGAMGDNYIKILLSYQGMPNDLVPPYVKKLIAVVAHLEKLDNDPKPDAFSEKEDEFIKTLCSIQKCSWGKDGGINDSYARLPKSAQFKEMEFLDNIIYTAITSLFDGVNSWFKKLTGIAADGKVFEPIHQGGYGVNLIGHEVGIYDPKLPPEFDKYTNVLNDHLLALSKQEFLNSFYHEFKPGLVIKAILEETNSEMMKPMSQLGTYLFDLFGHEKSFFTYTTEESSKHCWNSNYPAPDTLTEYGAIQFLLKIGALLKVEEKKTEQKKSFHLGE